MYQTTLFETLLIQKAGLLSLQKGDCDLLLIAQTNTITYAQLRASGIHGHTGTGGRLSLKKLETEGYLTAKTMSNSNNLKYYMLTSKGKKRVEKVFSAKFLADHGIDLDRRPPTSQFQLPHRINTSDLYCSYISCPVLKAFPSWVLEYGYTPPANPYSEKEHPPRCDAKLEAAHHTYYIEQDNGTQGDAALEQKLKQYLNSSLFLGKSLKRNRLVFTTMSETKEKPAGKPPYTVYRLILKAIRIWDTIEKTSDSTYDFTAICKQIREGTHPAHTLLSGAESRVLQNLAIQYPSYTLADMAELKKKYLHDSTITDNKKSEQDAIFQKRLEMRFYRLAKDRENATLLYRLQQGMHLYVLPNHRIKDFLPYICKDDYGFSDRLLKLLYQIGIYNIECWRYSPLYQLKDSRDTSYWFSNVLASDTQDYIIFEDICHDIGGRARVRHFLSTHHGIDSVILLLFATGKQNSAQFFREIKSSWTRKENKALHLCFIDKTEDINKLEHSIPYCIHLQGDTISFAPVDLDYDSYSEKIQIIEREVESL